jgi:hypothetical protein
MDCLLPRRLNSNPTNPLKPTVGGGHTCPRAQHGYTTLDKVTAIEASNVGAGFGELAGAQANLLFCVKLVMPWVYGEIFARSINSFPGAPFLVAAVTCPPPPSPVLLADFVVARWAFFFSFLLFCSFPLVSFVCAFLL